MEQAAADTARAVAHPAATARFGHLGVPATPRWYARGQGRTTAVTGIIVTGS
ncbi:hypothetical protein SCATT_12630 [Streptantibioticus cattleyicolor NRRL 8057 = DSM 46488]|uniref:Uncharacterized protein n=1 Tax=Streptantibioticus cattleyicolor (strain ATCC 35852 / DSM 46488 / JCM 4925 / NBRC 14057 / NRRL 8057) TaxID=1003195 RepID=G8WTJ2_STREN|nr:hypothetical protein SCATT_12630 [Streptantibioticus cattleyicolor NRRL 8057 = DSM 46488]